MRFLMLKIVVMFGFGLTVLVQSTVAAAQHSRCYTTLSLGKGTVHELGTTKAEDRLLAQSYVVGSYSTNAKSTPYNFGIGCHVHKNVILEVTHREGLKAEVDGIYGIAGTVAGTEVKTDLFAVKRHAELSGYSASIIGQVNIIGPIYGTAKIGALYGKAFLSATSPKIPYDIEATRRIEGVVPIAGLGGMYKERNSRFAFGFDAEWYGKPVTIFNIYLRTYF